MKRALTIIELIIAIVLMGVIASLGAEVIKTTYIQQMRTAKTLRLEQDAKKVAYTIASALRTSVKESARLRPSVLAQGGKMPEANNCVDAAGDAACVYLYNQSINMITDANLKTLELAMIDRPYGRYMSSVNETGCVINLVNRDYKFQDGNGCFIDDGAAKRFRCFALSLERDPTTGAFYDGGKADTINNWHTRLKGCNQRLLSDRYLDPVYADVGFNTGVRSDTVKYALSAIQQHTPWFGLFFRGDYMANSSTFIERDLYPFRLSINNVGNATGEFTSVDALQAPGNYAELLVRLDDKNFAVSNAFDIINSLQYFELVQAYELSNISDTTDSELAFKPCTQAPCALMSAKLSFDYFIRDIDNLLIMPDTLANEDEEENYLTSGNGKDWVDPNDIKLNELRQKIFTYSSFHLLANNVASLEIIDHLGVREVQVCLVATMPPGGLAGSRELKVCKGEII